MSAMKSTLVFLLLFTLFSPIRTLKLTGIAYGNQGWNMEQVANLTLWTNKRQIIIVLFTEWCDTEMNSLFYTQLRHIWNSSSIPMITWQPFGCNMKSEPGIMKLIHNNTYDSYINQFAERFKKWLAGNDSIYGNEDDRRAYLRLAHEMNGNWYPWSLGSTPEDYILAWRHVYNIFSNQGIDSTRLQWVWCVNNLDFGNYTAENYWIGDNYTDWIGVDAYNFGIYNGHPWAWPNEILDNMIGRLRRISSNKPLAINEYGTSSLREKGVSDVESKTQWLNLFCDYISNNSDVKLASYFNKDQNIDLAIFGGLHGDIVWNNFTAYTAYKNCLQTDQWIQPNMTDQRLITDEQFAGRI